MVAQKIQTFRLSKNSLGPKIIDVMENLIEDL